MFFDVFMLLGGLILLVFAGDFLVKGAVGLAEIFKIPAMVIGLTIVAFGTSAPELMVSLQSALGGLPDIAVGNVVGSNIANILLVMGAPALITTIPADRPGLIRNATVMVIFTLIFMWMMNDGALTFVEGVILFAGLLGYIATQFIRSRSTPDDSLEVVPDYHDEIGDAPHSISIIAVFLIGGLVGLPIAAHFTVEGASGLAKAFGVSDAAIGLTIVAIGTSLPELATSFIAALRKNGDVAFGNIIGSNIFNIAGIMGITSMVVAVPVADAIRTYDMWVMLAVSVLLLLICLAKIKTGRVLGAAMLVAFAAYIVSVF